ncbi:flavin reductase family protein [Paenibacillus frigoriresistens]|nr:flavin reductase family protein [Paenibacillus frigoriresistens]
MDGKKFREALGSFATGVTVIGVNNDQTVHGMTANAVSSVSLDPPLILICVDHRAKTLPMIREAGAFSVNILSKEQENISRYFANQPLDQIPEFTFTNQETEAPILNNALTALDCKVHQEVEAGDHTIFIGRVQNIIINSGQPLCFFKGKYTILA